MWEKSGSMGWGRCMMVICVYSMYVVAKYSSIHGAMFVKFENHCKNRSSKCSV